MSVPVCFEEIIGLTRTIDACSDLYNISTSDSGLFLDELPGLSLKILSATDNSTTIMEKYERAKETAINSFKTDALQAIFKYNEPRRQRFSGDIGGKCFTRLLDSNTYYGLRMFSDIRGATFTLRGVSLILNTTEAVNLQIYDDYDLLYTFPLTSQAGRPHRTDIAALELELNTNYYFLISPAGLPYSNKLTCGCGGYHWCFNQDPGHTCYKTSRDGWTNWAMIAGVQGDDLNERDDWTTVKNANGMILHGNFNCNFFDAFCSEESDYENNDVDKAIAWAILYRTAMFMVNYIINTGEISRYTLLGNEALNESLVQFADRYANIIEYIAQNISIDRNDCLCCKSPMGMGKMKQML